jgi:RNA polymerase sigma factor (sigma-70 family)
MAGDNTDESVTSNRWADMSSAILAGNSATTEEFVRVFYPHVMSLAIARLHDVETAREITQEALFDVLQALKQGRLREPTKLPAFVAGTARNIINHHIQRSALHPGSIPLDPETAGSIDNSFMGGERFEEDERRDLVREGLRVLNPTNRQILQLTLAEGLRPREIAARMGMKPEDVRNRKTRALRAVQKKIRKLMRKAPPRHTRNGDE